MAFRSASSTSGNTGSTLAVPVPAGVQANDIILLLASYDGGVQPALSGFTVLATQATNFGPDGQQAVLFWKRAAGADTGSYTLTGLASGSWAAAYCAAWSGRDTANPPVTGAATLSANNVAGSAAITATTVTALAGDDLAFMIAIDHSTSAATGTFTPAAGFTALAYQDAGFGGAGMWYEDNVAAGATGTVSGSGNISQAWATDTRLVRIPAATGSTVKPTKPSRSNQAVMRAATR